MLFRAYLTELQRLAFLNASQRMPLAFVTLFVVFTVGVRRGHLVNAQISVELLHRPGSAEGVIAGANVDGSLIKDRREHLRRDEALPDQLVELEQIVVQILPDVFGSARNVGRSNRFVCF